MTPAAIIALCIGVLYLVYFGLMLLRRDAVHTFLTGFPRNGLAAKILTAFAIGWFGWLLHETNFGRFEQLKPGVYVGVPFAYLTLLNASQFKLTINHASH